jgi:hypothetical protein
LVEHVLGKDEVTGSIPVVSSRVVSGIFLKGFQEIQTCPRKNSNAASRT